MNKYIKIAERLAEDYVNFKDFYKQELKEKYLIDCGTDYARWVLDEVLWDIHSETYIW
jgi:hypothetical protein